MLDVQLKAEAAAAAADKRKSVQFKDDVEQQNKEAGAGGGDQDGGTRASRSSTALTYSRTSVQLEGKVDDMRERAKVGCAVGGGREEIGA